MTIHSSRPYSIHLLTLQSSKLHGSQLPRLATEFGHPLALLFLWPLMYFVKETMVDGGVCAVISIDRCRLWSYVRFLYNTAILLERQKIGIAQLFITTIIPLKSYHCLGIRDDSCRYDTTKNDILRQHVSSMPVILG
jgi:hypothetical protein